MGAPFAERNLSDPGAHHRKKESTSHQGLNDDSVWQSLLCNKSLIPPVMWHHKYKSYLSVGSSSRRGGVHLLLKLLVKVKCFFCTVLHEPGA